MLSMANAVIESNSTREIWMFYGVRNLREPIHNGYLRELSHKHDHFNYVVCCSNPDPDDLQGRDFDHHGRIDTDLLKQHLKTNNYDFFICGPPPLMSALTQALAAWGVPKSDIRTEAFGPASVPKPKKKEATKAVATANAIKVEFTRSKKSANWDSTSNNLLDFGEDNGALMQGGCRVGNCGTCEVAVLSGEVEYNCDPEYSDLGEGCCLACISTPKGNVVLDA
jgi:ferredoxin-NADP reductase